MAHDLARFSKDVLEKPQLITMDKFKEIEAYLEERNSGLYQMAVDATKNKVDRDYLTIENGIATIDVSGSLTYKSTFWQALCGGISYVQLLREVNTIAEMPDVHTILLMVDSSGGYAYRCFETARSMRKVCDDAGKKLVAYIDGTSASAAYAITSAAHEVVINPDAEAGSIGVLVRLTNTNEKDKKEGIEHSYITAGASKVPFDKDGEFRSEFLQDLQERVNMLYANFVSHVATLRGISEDVVRSTEAKMFSAKEALNLGLVDSIMEASEFFEYLEAENRATTSVGVNKTNRTFNMAKDANLKAEELSTEQNVVEDSKLEEIDVVEPTENAEEQSVEKDEAEGVGSDDKDVATAEASEVIPSVSAEAQKIAALEAQLASLQTDFNAKLDAEKAKAELAAKELKNKKMLDFESQAKAWAFAGVDAKEFAAQAIDGTVSLEMFTSAMAKAQSAVETSAAMEELGSEEEEAPKAKEPVDGVEAALASNSKIKFKK